MKIIKLALSNFRQFYGKQEIKFSTDDYKNITLVHAENGTGKTALLNSILWCFYEKTTENFKERTKILNTSAKAEGITRCSVEIEFETDKGKLFYVRRTLHSSNGNTKFQIFEIDDNHYKPIDNPISFINSVIPRDISSYFFFQGEGIGKITSTSSGSKVKEALKQILGFTIAEKALEDIKAIKKSYYSQFKKLDKKGELSTLANSIQQLESDIEKNKKTIDDTSKAINHYENKIKDIENKLSCSNSELVKNLQSQRIQIESFLKKEKQRLQQAEKDKIRLVSQYATSVFGFELSQKAMDFIDEKEYKGTIPSPYNEQLVKDILEQCQCICGAKINPGTQAYNNIHELLKSAGDPQLESRILKARSQLSVLAQDSSKAKDAIRKNADIINAAEENIQEYKNQLEEISKKIAGTESEEKIKELEKNLMSAKQKRDQDIQVKARAERDKESANNELMKKRQEYQRLNTFTGELKKYQDLINCTENIEKKLQSTLDEFNKDIHTIIINKVNKYLEKFVRQDYKAKLNPNTYEIRLIDSYNDVVAESEGQSLLLSLTFISSLIELSRERKNASGQLLTPGAVAPFIVDAPFGDLDNKYKGNIAKKIPESVNQVVFFLSSSHWQGAVEQNIREKIGMEYNLVLEETAPNNGKQDDFITILGEKYETVRYNQGVNRTVINKVGDYVQ